MHPPKASSTPIDGTSREGNDSHREGEESFPPPKSGEQSNDQNANDSSISTKSTSDENLPPKRSADNRVLFPEKVCGQRYLNISAAGKFVCQPHD